MIEVNAFKSDEDIREYLNKKYINLYNNKFFNVLSEENKNILITKLINPFQNKEASMIFLEGERKSGVTSILKAFMLYAYLKGFIVIYITGKNNDGNMIKNAFFEEYLDDIVYTVSWSDYKTSGFNNIRNKEKMMSKVDYMNCTDNYSNNDYTSNIVMVFDDINPLEMKNDLDIHSLIYHDVFVVSGYTYNKVNLS